MADDVVSHLPGPPSGIWSQSQVVSDTGGYHEERLLIDESPHMGKEVRIALTKHEGGIYFDSRTLIVPRSLWDYLLALRAAMTRPAPAEELPPLTPDDYWVCDDCQHVTIPVMHADDGEGHPWACINPECGLGREQMGELSEDDWQQAGLSKNVAKAICLLIDYVQEADS